MGGFGSGSRPTHASVADCRVIEIAELCGGGRASRQPRGEIRWLATQTKLTRAHLRYAISDERAEMGRLVLTLDYKRTPDAPASSQDIALAGGEGVRFLAACPGCGRPVRKLFAPPGADQFLCRDCHRLVYRHMPKGEALSLVQEAMGSLLQELHAFFPEPASARSVATGRGALKALLATLQEELPLRPQELRIWCLRLSRASLSLRQIAALVETSKSSVARYLAAGRGGIDMPALVAERLDRLWFDSRGSSGDDPEALGAQLAMIGRDVRRFGLQRTPGSESEERVVVLADSDDEGGTNSERSI
jgi:hypothetical protein